MPTLACRQLGKHLRVSVQLAAKVCARLPDRFRYLAGDLVWIFLADLEALEFVVDKRFHILLHSARSELMVGGHRQPLHCQTSAKSIAGLWLSQLPFISATRPRLQRTDHLASCIVLTCTEQPLCMISSMRLRRSCFLGLTCTG